MNNLHFNSEEMKLLICGILTPFIVYSIMYIAHAYGVTGYFHGHDDGRSVKLMAVWASSSIQVLLSVFFVNKKRVFIRVARGSVNVIIGVLCIPVASLFIYVLFKTWDTFDRFGSVYLNSPSGIVNGIFYQFMVYFTSYTTVLCIFSLLVYIKIQIKRSNHGRK